MSHRVKKIIKREAAKKYALIYSDADKMVARRAFFDGIIFWDMVKAGAITEDMLNEDFFTILSESNHTK